jgi:hypothetical protein
MNSIYLQGLKDLAGKEKNERQVLPIHTNPSRSNL